MNEANYKVLTNIIGAVETGGQVYGKQRYDAYAAAYTNSPKEYTCTLGAFQFYGSEAKQLIQMIYNANPTEFKSIDINGVIQAKLSTDWVTTKWNPSSSQKSILIKLITTETGKSCQDKLVRERIDKYLNKAYEYGISKSDVKVLMMWCEIEHLGGLNPTKRIFNRASKPYTVESIMASLKKDQSDSSSNNQVGDKIYWSRHLKCQEYINKYAVDEQSSSTKKKEINSKNFLNAVKSVYQTAHDNKYTYGDSKGIPPTSDKVISCDRLIAKALWDMGYTDQPTSTSGRSGICVDQMDSYLQKYGFVKTTKTSEIKPGAVVSVGSGTSPDHVFVVVSINGTKVSKYDMGSQQRINASQPFNNIELVEWSNKKFIAAYNCKQVEVSTPKNYLSIGDNGAEVSTLQSNLNKVMNAGLAIDGSFGKLTESALKAFQQKYGLEVDGIYGGESKAKMSSVLNSNTQSSATNSSTDVNKVLRIAEAEVGYCEKRSNSNLDDKTANAGSGNYTKYWRDIYPSFQGQAWCDCFVDWCFYKAYGATVAQTLECGGYKLFYTPDSAQCYKNKKQWHSSPKVGDQIFFKNSTRIHHTGIVYKVDNSKVYTIEGNTSNGTAVVANGGMVCKKSYSLSNSAIAGYGRPNYSSTTVNNSSNSSTFLKRGDVGSEVELLQVHLNGVMKSGLAIDGSFGAATEAALKAFQRKYGLEVDGIYGSKSKAKLDALVNEQYGPSKTPKWVGRATTVVNVRTGAGTSFGNLPEWKTLGPGNLVDVCDTVNGWYYVRIAGKYFGYVKSNYIIKV